MTLLDTDRKDSRPAGISARLLDAPASLFAKLAQERPATYMLFDILLDETGTPLIDAPLRERRAHLERFIALYVPPGDARLRLSPATLQLATVEGWYARVGVALDGVVAKRLDAPYRGFASIISSVHVELLDHYRPMHRRLVLMQLTEIRICPALF